MTHILYRHKKNANNLEKPEDGLALTHSATMWSDNKVRELATVCLPWQHWTKALVGFDDVDISAFHSCVVVVVVVDLWQSLSEWHL
jgi:hypothetical protein